MSALHHARLTPTQIEAAARYRALRAHIDKHAWKPVLPKIEPIAPVPIAATILPFVPPIQVIYINPQTVAKPFRRSAEDMRLQAVVCNHYGISLEDMNSGKRHRPLVEPRHVAMWLMTKLTDHSLPSIGKKFGGRDHTTILHARNKIERDRGTDARLDGLLTGFLAELGAP